MLLQSWVVPGPPNKPTLVPEFIWLVTPEKLMSVERELAFPEFCYPLLALGGANVAKGFVPLIPGGANVTNGVVPLVPRGPDTVVDPTVLPPDNLEGESLRDGAGANAWALPMEGLGTIGVPPGVVVVALAAAATEGLRTMMGVPPGVVTFALAVAAMAATL